MNASLNIERARFNMVEQQVRTWEVLDQEVLDLLYAVHRERFVPPEYASLAFSDLEIPLKPNAKPGERLGAPKMEARVLQELGVRHTDSVLEVGTGSGYLTALLAHRAQKVISVEISDEIARFGSANLARGGIENVEVEVGDGSRGWQAGAPYDVIVLTSSTPVLAREFTDQLKPGGRLFAVVGDSPVMAARVYTHKGDGFPSHQDLFETVLAPLVNAPQPQRFKF